VSGGVPPSSRAGKRAVFTGARHSAAYQTAASMYERFTGHDVEELGVLEIPGIPSVVAVIGPCDGLMYSTVRDGKHESYIHEFAADDRPLLCIAPNGRRIILAGGAFKFTDRGIVDDSDLKNQPRKRR